jgi:hypothetical protein
MKLDAPQLSMALGFTLELEIATCILYGIAV